MKRNITGIAFALVAIAASLPAFAITITDTYGDRDGFGTGVQNGAVFFPWQVATEVDDEGFTDRWVFGAQSWSHTYDTSGITNITNASLTVFTGGQGLGVFVSSEIYIDGNLVGNLTDGEVFGFNIAREDHFDLTGFSNLLNGSNSLEIRTFYNVDAWVLDFSEISITGDYIDPQNPNAPVPEPATMSLLGLGLAGLVLRKRGLRA